MANSPDVSPFVDLTIFDEDPVEILNNILEGGRAILPNWNPQSGQIEVVLAEIFADRTAQLAASINRLPSTTTEVLLQLFGITRSDGTRATATIEISQAGGGRIPAASRFLYTDAVTGSSYIFTLDTDFTSTSGTAAVTALDVGTGYNLAADGQGLVLLTNSADFISATFDGDSTGGTGPESDLDYFTRGAALLASYTTAATTANQIKNYVATNKTYAWRVAAYDRRKYRDRDTTATSFSEHDGHVLVAVGSLVSNAAQAATELAVSASNLADLFTSVEARTPAGLVVEVMSAELAKIHVNVTVKKLDGFTASVVETGIKGALQLYLSSNLWDWNFQTIRRNEIISLIDAVDGVDYVDTLTMDAVPVLGSNNVGYYTLASGSKSIVNLDIIEVSPDQEYGAGELGFYYVDADVDPPVIYEFVNTSAVTITGGAASAAPFEAVSNGVDFNDTNNSGKVDPTQTYPGTGTTATSLGKATLTSNSSFVGGSNDVDTFVPLNNATPTANVSTDLYLRNLGTLVTYGTLTVTQV